MIPKLCKEVSFGQIKVVGFFIKSEFFLTVSHSLMKWERSTCAHLGQSTQDWGTHLELLVGSVEGASDWILSVL